MSVREAELWEQEQQQQQQQQEPELSSQDWKKG